jgi:nitronate monooxygenase
MFEGNRYLELIGTNLPLIQSPMAGAQDHRLAIAVSKAGGLGSLPCALLDVNAVESELKQFRAACNGPANLNFFCHKPQIATPAQETKWRNTLSSYYAEHNINIDTTTTAPIRNPFDETMCQFVEAHKPEVVSFHFGLPSQKLLNRVKVAGSVVMSSATTVAEAVWLEGNGCDVIIAQGVEAGGHRGMFLNEDVSAQPGLFALLPQVVDAVSVPVVAAGAIADGRGIAAAFTLGASAVQMGTAFLLTDESTISDLHRQALRDANENKTAVTNLFSGRPARSLYNRLMVECGPISNKTPVFPTAGAALAPLKKAAEENDQVDFSSLWSGQAARQCKTGSAQALANDLIEDATRVLKL